MLLRIRNELENKPKPFPLSRFAPSRISAPQVDAALVPPGKTAGERETRYFPFPSSRCASRQTPSALAYKTLAAAARW